MDQKYMTLDYEKENLMKALVTLSIEKVLLKMGTPVFEKVSNKLQKEYKCYIPDCYVHPEYLDDVLKSLFGNSHVAISESIRDELSEFTYDNNIKTLIKTISA
jgi:hypothetical protein